MRLYNQPTVSVGNVGQLACDVIISTLNPTRVGYLYDDSILPVVGNNPFVEGAGQIATALDVYESSEHKLVIVQQRAPCVKGKKSQFVERLFGWIQTCRFKQVVILTSVFAHERRDVQLVGPQTRYIAAPKTTHSLPDERLSNDDVKGWIQLEQRISSIEDVDNSTDSQPFIPGSGLTKALYNKCLSGNLNVVVLLVFCAEGDNISDALLLSSFFGSNKTWIADEQQFLAMASEVTVYDGARKYWESVPATVSGMLDGFTQINSVDLAASNKFISHFIQGSSPLFKPNRAVDCGSGIGRVTKRLLLPLFSTVDMVDINHCFLDEAKNFLGPDSSRVENFICTSLHSFVPDQGRYDAIWCQWVLGQLIAEDLVEFFRRCKTGLTSNGVLFVKENMGSSKTPDYDAKDRSWTRPREVWLDLIHQAGLKIIREEKQPSFPKDLYEVRMFAIK